MTPISEFELQAMQSKLARNRNPAAADTAKREKWAAGEEKDFQREIARYCDLNSIYCLAPAFGKKTRLKRGHPDMTLMRNGLVCCVETKTEGATTTPDQDTCISELKVKGIPVLVACSLEEAIAFIRLHLHI